MRIVRDVHNSIIGKIPFPIGQLDGQTYFNISRLHDLFKTFRGTVAYYLGKLPDSKKQEVLWASSSGRSTVVVTAAGLIELIDLLSTSKSCKDWSPQDVNALRALAEMQVRVNSEDSVRPDELRAPIWESRQHYKQVSLERVQSQSDDLFLGKMCLDVVRYAFDNLDSKLPYLTIRPDGYSMGKQVLTALFKPYDVSESGLLLAAKNLYLWTAWGTPATAFVWAMSIRLGIAEDDIPNQMDLLRSSVTSAVQTSPREYGYAKLQETVDGEAVIAYRVLG